ncbi:MAG: hypothetical protein ACE5NA_00075 [Nitrospiraceae bacterium]
MGRPLEERRQFRGAWVSNLTPARSYDGFRRPINMWESVDATGSLESTPGNAKTSDKPGEKVNNLYRAISSQTGEVLRLAMTGSTLYWIDAIHAYRDPLITNLNSASLLTFTTMSNKQGEEFVFMFNGVDIPFKVPVEATPVQALGNNTATAANPAGTNLQSTGANFQTSNVVDGWTVFNVTDGSSAFITGITDENNLVHDALLGGFDNQWEVGDSFIVTKVSTIGLQRPDVSQVVVSLSPGGRDNVRGFVKYWISEVQGIVEGPLSLPSATVNAFQVVNDEHVGTRVELTFDDALYYNNTYRIYRTYKDGPDPFFIGEIEVGPSTPGATFVDDVLDADLGDPPELMGDPPPASITSAITFFGRMYGQAKNVLFWSDVEEPESWFTATDGNFRIVGQNDGDVGSTLIRGDDSILFGKQSHLYGLFGRTPREFEIVELRPSDQPTRSIGVPSPNAFTYYEGGIFFYFDKRFYQYAGGRTIRRLSGLIEEDIKFYIGDGDFLGTDPWDVTIGRHAERGRVWATVAESTIFYDENLRRFVGAAKYGYRAYLTDDFGNVEELVCGGFKTDILPDLGALFRANYDAAIDGLDAGVTLLPFSGPGAGIRRFLYVDLWLSSSQAQPITADLKFKVDGLDLINVLGVTVRPATNTLRTRHRHYTKRVQGHDLELTFTAVDNGTTKVQLFEVRLVSQDQTSGSAALLKAS